MAVGGAGAAPAEAPQRKGIDYSKFDNIEDSDDEKPQSKTTAAAGAKAAEETPHCHNCHKDTSKPLRCGVCKKVAYCSAACQKEDWRYHKRICQPAPKEKEKDEKPKEPPRKPPEERPARKKEEKEVVDDEENFTWYRHREWKPTSEPKQEFKPEKIAVEAVTATDAATGSKPSAGSAWNAAGTWEEKDVTALARSTLKERLAGMPDVDAASGSLVCQDVEGVEGDASKPVIRGKLRHIFDLSFKVKFIFRWMDAAGQQQAKGQISVGDFTNDTFAEGVLAAPEVELSFGEARLLDGGRRHAVEASLGAKAWPPPAGSLMAGVAARMEAWAKEYTETS